MTMSLFEQLIERIQVEWPYLDDQTDRSRMWAVREFRATLQTLPHREIRIGRKRGDEQLIVTLSREFDFSKPERSEITSIRIYPRYRVGKGKQVIFSCATDTELLDYVVRGIRKRLRG